MAIFTLSPIVQSVLLCAAQSALANGGQLLRPQLVLQMAAPGAEPTYKLAPQTVGAVPLSPETLATVRQGLWEVVHEQSGTAAYRFKGFN